MQINNNDKLNSKENNEIFFEDFNLGEPIQDNLIILEKQKNIFEEINLQKNNFKIDEKEKIANINDKNSIKNIDNQLNTEKENILSESNNNEINKLFILETDRIGDKNSKNICYQNIIYANRKFNMIYTKREALQSDNIYYYCKYHRTTINSTKLTSKNFKKKLAYVMLK